MPERLANPARGFSPSGCVRRGRARRSADGMHLRWVPSATLPKRAPPSGALLPILPLLDSPVVAHLMLLKQKRLYSCKNRTKQISCTSSLIENESVFHKTPQALAQDRLSGMDVEETRCKLAGA